MPGVQHLTVTPAEDGLKVFQFLERRLNKGAPRPLIMKWARTGQLRVNGGRVGPFARLSAGQDVRVPPFTPPVPSPGQTPGQPDTPEPAPLAIVHEDGELLVIAKPAGLPSQSGSRHPDSVQTRLKARFAGADFVPNITHRLDKDTSGLLLAGKTYAAVRRLSDAFAARTVGKAYLAWVRGDWPHGKTIRLKDNLEKSGQGPAEKVRTGSGKLALADVSPLARRPGATLLRIDLLTGRTHQIRVQLASRGHPILGDRKYGRRPHATPLLLHCWQLRLPDAAFVLPPPWEDEWAVGEWADVEE